MIACGGALFVYCSVPTVSSATSTTSTLFVSIVPCQRAASSTTSTNFTLSDVESISVHLCLVRPLKLCIFVLQMIVWVFCEQPLVDITQKENVVSSSTAGLRYVCAKWRQFSHTAVSLYRPRNNKVGEGEEGWAYEVCVGAPLRRWLSPQHQLHTWAMGQTQGGKYI